MTLNAVQLYLKESMQGLQAPLYTQQLLVLIEPMIPGHIDLDQPQLYIWGAAWKDQRDSIPRGRPGKVVKGVPQLEPGTSGWKYRRYSISFTLIDAGTNAIPNPAASVITATTGTGYAPAATRSKYARQTTPNREQAFPTLIAVVEKALYALDVPAEVRDPQLGDISKVMDPGEVISGDYALVATLADQALLRHCARLTLDLTEMYNA